MDRSSETLSLSLTPQFDFEWFTARALARADDFSFAGAANWAGERSTLSVTSRWTDQSLLSAERFDTGILNLSTRRLGTETDLSWTLTESERRLFTLFGAYQTADYHGDIAGTALQDYRYSSLGANEGFVRSDRLELDASLSAGLLDVPAARDQTYSYNAQVGFREKATERLSVSGDLGVNRRTYGPLESASVIGDLKVSYVTLQDTLTFSAQRSASPSGYGLLTERDQVQFLYSRLLSDRLTASTEADLIRITDAIGPFTLDNRTYGVMSATLGWRATETWTISGHVVVDGSRTQVGLANAHGWQIGFQTAWNPNPKSISR